jgi:hypothetical protein
MAVVTLPHTSKADTDPNLFSDTKANDQAIVDQVNGALDSTNLADNAVTTAKITDDAVTAGKVAGLQQGIIDTRAAVAGEVEALKAEKEMLAARDREAREELERLRLTRQQ